MSDDEKVEYAIHEGHRLARLIEEADSLGNLQKLTDNIDVYTDFIDDNFGVVGDSDDEKESNLSTSLYVALNWKTDSLSGSGKNQPATQRLADDFLRRFEDELDSKSWV